MLLKFDEMETAVFPQFKGGEGQLSINMLKDEHNKIMRGLLLPGSSIGLHTHETDSEILYILSGKGKVLYDGEYLPLSAGSCHYCPKGHQHCLINDSDGELTFLAVIPEHGA